MNRYIVLSLILLVSSSAFGMKKMGPFNWVHDKSTACEGTGTKDNPIKSQFFFTDSGEDKVAIYQNPLVQTADKSIPVPKQGKIVDKRDVNFPLYSRNEAKLQPVQSLIWTREETNETKPGALKHTYHSRNDHDVSSALQQSELTINPCMKFDDLQKEYVARKNAYEAKNKEEAPKAGQAAIDYAKGLLSAQQSFKEVETELLRRKWAKEAAILALQKAIDSKESLKKANETQVDATTTRLETKKRTLEGRKTSIEAQKDTKGKTTKRSILNSTLDVANNAVAQEARQEALAQDLGSSSNKAQAARQLVAQAEQVAASKKALEERLQARQNEIDNLETQVAQLTQSNKVLDQEIADNTAMKTSLVNTLDVIDGFIANPKIEQPKKAGWFSWFY